MNATGEDILSELPEFAEIQVRPMEILDLAKRIILDEAENALSCKERTSLLVIIHALCKLARVDPSHPATAANRVDGEFARAGLSVGKRTIESFLKKIDDAVARKSIRQPR